MSPETLTCEITDVAFGGRGVARHEGKVYFVAGAIPGDTVVAEVEEQAPRYANARAVSFAVTSPLRGQSPCPHFGRCGGCLWLGVDYGAQAEWKKSFVTNALKRIAKLPDAGDIRIHTRPESVLAYRNRIHLKGRVDDDGTLALGYYAMASHDLVPITRCAIADPVLNDAVAALAGTRVPGLTPQEFKVEFQALPAHEARAGERPLVVTIYPDRSMGREPLRPLAAHVAATLSPAWVGMASEPRRDTPFPFDRQFGLTYHTQPGQFQQVNVPLNHVVRAMVRDIVTRLAPDRVLDVFCGSGNLSLALIDGKRYVEGVENNPRAIAVARHNVAANGLPAAVYLAEAADAHLWALARGGARFDMVIVDPPRDGMYAENIPLLKIAPKHILYVSCDPATLARDLGRLCRKDAYRVASLDCFDFFPNTYHVESMVLLERQD